MSFDEMYDEMLHEEFSSSGKHLAKAAAAEPELVQSASRGRHAAATSHSEKPRGLQRYRTAGLVGAGGLACAAAGAFLGGLGGYFTIAPAAAHAVAAPTVTQDLPLAQAVGHSAHTSSSSVNGTSAVMAAQFSKVSGSLTQGIAPFASLTSAPLGNLPVSSLPGLGGGSSPVTGGGTIGSGTVGDGSNGGGGGGGGGVTGCASSSTGIDLTCIVSSLTGALGNLGSLTGGDPGSLLDGLPGLTGVVSDVTGTLQNLTSLLSIASLPLPTGGVPTTVLAGTSGSPVTGALSTAGGSPSNPVVSALAPVLNTVGSVTGSLGSTGSPIPTTLPLPTTTGTTVPSLPVDGTTSASGSGSTSGGSTSSSTTVDVPLPLPISTPTVTIGGLSVGVSSSGSTSGLTLTLP